MRRIRLALVAGKLDDSARRLLDLLARRLQAREYDVSLYRLNRGGTGGGTSADEALRRRGVRVADFTAHFRRDPRIVFSLADDFGHTHPDIVYSWGAAADIAGRIAALRSGTPVIIRASLGNLPQPPMQNALVRLLDRWTTAHVTFSGGMVEHLLQQHRLPPDRVQLIPPGIESDLPQMPAKPAPAAETAGALPELPPAARLVIAAGSIDRHQGLHKLLWAMGIIRYSGLPAHLWVVGQGEDLSRLRHQSVLMDVAHLVHFIGPRDDLPQLLERADVFAMPTRHEVLNLAPLQAMLQGVPLVLDRSPGALELSDGGRCALLADADHPKDVASAIYRQLCDVDKARQRAEAARRRVLEFCSVDLFIERHDDLLRRLIAAKGVSLTP